MGLALQLWPPKFGLYSMCDPSGPVLASERVTSSRKEATAETGGQIADTGYEVRVRVKKTGREPEAIPLRGLDVTCMHVNEVSGAIMPLAPDPDHRADYGVDATLHPDRDDPRDHITGKGNAVHQGMYMGLSREDRDLRCRPVQIHVVPPQRPSFLGGDAG